MSPLFTNGFKFFKRFRGNTSKPRNLFADPWRVFDLSKSECEAYEILHESGFVLLVTGKSSHESELNAWFEVWFRSDKVSYSLFRSQRLKEVEEVYSKVKPVMNKVMKYSNNNGIHATASTLKAIVKVVIKENPLWTSAHIAAKFNFANLFTPRNEDIIRDLNTQRNPDYMSPLHVAIKYQNVDVVKAIFAIHGLAETAVDLRLRDGGRNTILHFAAISSKEILKCVLNSISSFGSENKLAFLTAINNFGLNPLQIACYKDKPENVKEFFRAGLPLDLMVITKHKEAVGNSDQKLNFIQLEDNIIADIDNSEIKFGGTPLHWTKTRKSLEYFVNVGIPLKVRNMNGETPLHVAVRKQLVKNYMFLLCSDDKIINCKEKNGNRALHIAVTSCDVTAVQALTVFESDINARNNLHQTARHIAASSEEPKSMNIIHILHSLGAERCPANLHKVVCFDGCSHDGTFDGTAFENWPKFAEEKLYDQCYYSVVEDAIQSSKAKNCSRIICFDGGGMKGVFAVQMLIELEKRLNKPINKCFDWISGTSAGSVIAALLSLGVSPKEMRKLVLLKFKDEVIRSDQLGNKKYDPNASKVFLKNAIGSETRMHDIKESKLIIFACYSDKIPFRLHLFRNYKSLEEIISENTAKVQNEKLWKACAASGTIPFDNSDSEQLIDGGIIANNPTVDTLSEFTRYNAAKLVAGRSDEIETLKVVVSIGTGKQPLSPFQLPKYRINILAEYAEFANLFIQQTTNPNWYVVERAESWCYSLGVPFFRINPPFNEIISAFETDESKIINGLWITKAYMHAIGPQLSQLFNLL